MKEGICCRFTLNEVEGSAVLITNIINIHYFNIIARVEVEKCL
jgi:hypothetical protein